MHSEFSSNGQMCCAPFKSPGILFTLAVWVSKVQISSIPHHIPGFQCVLWKWDVPWTAWGNPYLVVMPDIMHQADLGIMSHIVAVVRKMKKRRVKQMDRLTSLEELKLDKTAVTDAGLHQLTNLSSLEVLYLGNNQGVTSAGMVEVGRLTAFEKLWIHQMAVMDDGLQQLTALSSLKELALSFNQGVTTAGMVDVGRLTGLDTLWLNEAPVTDDGLQQLTGLSSLEVLSLSNRKGMSDAGMVHVGKLSGLEDLRLDGAAVTDDGLQQLTALTKLTTLYTPERGHLQIDDVRKRTGE
ncbi:unnamed protein product [Closterium sp. NIES-53]